MKNNKECDWACVFGDSGFIIKYKLITFVQFLPLGKLWEKGQENTANRVVVQIQINL